jgi:hypothetical protein
MRNKYMLIGIGVVAGVLLASVAVVLAGDLDSSAAPDATSSYTLEDIYDRLDAGTAGSQSTFTEPGSGPGSTMHTLNEIMGKAPAVDDSNGATTAQVLTGKTFWGLRTDGTWGTKTGTAAAGSNVDGADGSKTFNIPDGFYSGSKTCTANDADLEAGNIKSGVDIFGVTGSYEGTTCTGNATTTDVLYPKTFSNSSATGLTGELYGGCTCSGTLNGTRWCDNGDGTVTDLLGYNGKGQCLVWLKNAGCLGPMKWVDEGSWNGAQTKAGLLQHGQCSLSDGSDVGDWRLPTKSELVAITSASGTEYVRSGSMRAFTGVQSNYYWTSTTYAGNNNYAWRVHLGNGVVDENDQKSETNYVWPVRGGQ